MADEKKYLSKLTVGGQTYDLKDAEARAAIAGIQTSVTGGMHYVGETTTDLTDGATTATLTPKSSNSLSKTTGFVAGDIVISGKKEFVFNGTAWAEFGDMGDLKALAFKDSASGTVTPAGTNAASAVTLTGGETKKLAVTTITGTNGTETVHDTPTLNTESVGSASGWNAGQMFTAAVDEANETLTLTAGTAPSLTVTSKDVGVSLTAGSAKTVAKAASSATTVATGSVTTSGNGATVATALPTGGTAAAQKFTGTQATVTVS